MKATLNDFGIKFKKVLLLCDNDSAIKLTNNLVGILKEQSLNLLDIQTPTMQDARLKERVPQALINCWEDHLFHGHQRSKIVLHYQPLKLNTYPPVVIVHKFFG